MGNHQLALLQYDHFLAATVEAFVPLADFSGHVIPADFDPRFALTVLIGTVSPALDELAPGSAVTFAMHSPASHFDGTPNTESVYDFYLMRETQGGDVRFTWLSTLGASCAEDKVVGYPLEDGPVTPTLATLWLK